MNGACERDAWDRFLEKDDQLVYNAGDWKIIIRDEDTFILCERFATGIGNDEVKKVAEIGGDDWIRVTRGALVSLDQMRALVNSKG
jgi:hypothetical protein